MRQTSLLLLAITGIFAGSLFGAQPSEYKSGISLALDGVNGSDYKVEQLYHDDRVFADAVIYIKDSTPIRLFHNERNTAFTGSSDFKGTIGANGKDGQPNSGDEGVIMFRIDGDQLYLRGKDENPYSDQGSRMSWSVQSWHPHVNVYSSPFTFASLNYDYTGTKGIPVVGSTGLTGKISDKYTSFYKGQLDSAGDEWHAIHVADDDHGFLTANLKPRESLASDGKTYLFVVNPKTPTMRVSKTGNGEFYTTPAKVYWMPVIHDQTTYITPNGGSVSFELEALGGQTVYYRTNGGAWKNNGTDKITVPDSAFSDGANTLEYYYAGNEAFVKTREVVKNPTHPSLAESHGDRFWGNSENWKEIVKRIDSTPEIQTYWSKWLNDSSWSGYNRQVWIGTEPSGARKRIGQSVHTGGMPASSNAMVARRYGTKFKRNGAQLSFAEYVKQAALESSLLINMVGVEIHHNGGAVPSSERAYRGYYDFNDTIDLLFGYDYMAGYFRSDQVSGGMTPVEDYLLRDALASSAFQGLLHQCGMVRDVTGGKLGEAKDTGGMWDTAHKIAGAVVMFIMPSYSTEYYGTSGLDGNTTAYPWTPAPDHPYTWKEYFLDNSPTIHGYPNKNSRFGIEEYMFDSNGNWKDKVDYLNTLNMGHVFWAFANLQKLWAPEYKYPNMTAGFLNMAEGDIIGNQNQGARFVANAGALNAFFPASAPIGKSRMLNITNDSDQNSLNKQVDYGTFATMIWYDHKFSEGDGESSGNSTPVTAAPAFSVPSGTYLKGQSVSLSSATSGATIRYTTDGSTPSATQGSIYSSPITLTNSTTINAVAIDSEGMLSSIASRTYDIQSQVPTPSVTVAGDGWSSKTISIEASLADAIYVTTDGSTPTTASTLYDGPFDVHATTTIKALATKSGLDDSEISETSVSIGQVATQSGQFSVFPINALEGTIQVSVKATPSSSPADLLVGLAENNTPSFTFSDIAVIGRFNSSGFVDARNGGSYQASNSFSYEANVTYTFEFRVDLNSSTYDLYVYPQGGDQILIADNFAFRTGTEGATALNHFVIWSDGSLPNGSLIASDFGSSVDEPASPVPPSGLNVKVKVASVSQSATDQSL